MKNTYNHIRLLFVVSIITFALILLFGAVSLIYDTAPKPREEKPPAEYLQKPDTLLQEVAVNQAALIPDRLISKIPDQVIISLFYAVCFIIAYIFVGRLVGVVLIHIKRRKHNPLKYYLPSRFMLTWIVEIFWINHIIRGPKTEEETPETVELHNALKVNSLPEFTDMPDLKKGITLILETINRRNTAKLVDVIVNQPHKKFSLTIKPLELQTGDERLYTVSFAYQENINEYLNT